MAEDTKNGNLEIGVPYVRPARETLLADFLFLIVQDERWSLPE
jgi:hypothetical protein